MSLDYFGPIAEIEGIKKDDQGSFEIIDNNKTINELVEAIQALEDPEIMKMFCFRDVYEAVETVINKNFYDKSDENIKNEARAYLSGLLGMDYSLLKELATDKSTENETFNLNSLQARMTIDDSQFIAAAKLRKITEIVSQCDPKAENIQYYVTKDNNVRYFRLPRGGTYDKSDNNSSHHTLGATQCPFE